MAKTGGKRAKGLSQPASGPEIQWKDARWLSLAQPLAVIRLAMREVPAVKYALGVAGVVAVIAVIAALRIDLRVAAFGVPVLFIFMVVLVVFAHVAITSPDYFRLPAIIFIWVSLLLVIGVGVLLFSSVFFRTPVDLQEFLRGRRVDESVKMQVISIPRETETRVSPATAPASQAAAWAALAGRPLDLVKDATAQQEKQEYKRAWDLLTKAGKLQPQHPVIVDAQVKLAMDWLRNCTVVVGEETFVKIVDQVTPVLEARAASDAPDAADAMAHIAWGKVLKSYEEPPAPDINDEFGRVLKRDGNNPYAHAMLAVWIVTMNGAPEQAQRHIDRALSTGLARPVVRQFQMMVLQLGLLRDEPGIIPRVIRTWNEMRLNHESFPRAAPNSPCERAAMVHDVYFTPSGTEAIQKELNSILSPEDHLDTFKWLIQGWDMDHPPQRFWMGRLTEAREYYTEALKWYLSAIPRYRWLEQPTQEGIERCVKRGAAVNSTLIEGLRSPDAKERALFVVAAGMMGEKARPMLGRIVDAAKESDAKVRAKALEALPKLGASDGEVLPILLSSLSDADNDVRSAAQEAVVSFKGRAVPGLIQMLSSPGAANRQDAAYLLGKIGAPDASIAAPAVVTALKDADQDVRFRMLVTLKSIGGDAKVVVPALIEVMKSDKELRYLAAQALGQYGSVAKDAVGALTDALLETIQPDNRQSSISFVWALGQIGPDAAPAVETLIDATKTFEAELAGQAALALANIGTANKRALPPLIEAFKKEARQYQEPFCEAFVMMAEAAETQNDTSMLEVLGEAHRVMYQAEGVKIEYLERMRMAIQSLKAKSATAPAKSGG